MKIKHRSSHQSCSFKTGVLRNFAKFTGKHLRQSLFLNKFAGLRPTTLLKKRLWHRNVPAKFVKLLRAPLSQKIFGRLLLKTQHTITERGDRNTEKWRTHIKTIISFIGESEDVMRRKQLAIVSMEKLGKILIKGDRISEKKRLKL